MESSYGELRFSPKKDLNVTDQSITIKYEINHGLSTLITKEYPIQGTYLIKHNDDDVTVSSNGKDNEIEGTFDGIVNNSSKNIYENYSVYKCKSCHQTWCFSNADLYWRGFLVKQENLSSFHNRLSNKEKQIKRNGILVLIAIIVIGIFIISKI